MNSFDLDTTLIELHGENGAGEWTVRDAVEGVQIFGGIGSGKTSGSGRMIALKFLKAGFGGLVLTVKPDEKEDWLKYAKLAGREDDLFVVEPNGKYFFNFLEYESAGTGGLTENIVQVLKTVIHASEEKAGGGNDDPFWETALDMLIFNVIDLCKLAYGKVSVQIMFDIVQTLPRDGQADTKEGKQTAFQKAFTLARDNVTKQIEAWEASLSSDELEKIQEQNYEEVLCKSIADARTLKFIDQFFLESFMNLSEKTRSIIDFSFSGFLFRLLRDPVYSLFCNEPSNVFPENCLDGKIIILNLPVKIYHKIGRDSQIMFKYIWQRAMEKRNVKENGRPVFLWADEAQNYLHEHDAEYQATARSSRISTVYITQNLPNYLANMGGAKSEFRVKSFLGTLATKIFHANADMETNRYASELIGDGYFEDTSKTATAAGQFSSSHTRSLKIDRIVRPEAFTGLKTGGTRNKAKVEGYMHLQGNPLGHIKVLFDQDFTVNP